MRKVLLIAVLTSMVSATYAQENMMSKRGTPILPEAGDYSIGISAIPFINWVFDKSRIMSSSSASSASGAISAQVPMTFVGLYQVDATKAYRGRVGINFTSHKQEYNVDVNNDTIPLVQVVDEIKTSSMNITLGAGLQWRRGKGRLQGIYGVEAALMFGGGTKTTYTYGNAFITDTNSTWQADQEGVANIFDPVSGSQMTVGIGQSQSGRPTESKSGSSFGFGVDGFVGVEYFVAPKMSVSAEYNWGIMISSTGEGTTTTETPYYVNTTSQATAIRTTEEKNLTGKSSDFGVRNGDIGTSSTGNVVFHFYF